jgi:vacuolar-type H+-ATPase subunit F/Vma7
MILVVATVFSACNNDDTNEQGKFEPEFRIQETVVKPSGPGLSYVIDVVASEDVSWSGSISSDVEDFFTLTTLSGIGNGQLVFDLKENTGNDSRYVEISLIATSERVTSWEDSKTCTVMQIGQTPTIVITPSPSTAISSDPVASMEIEVVSNVEWMASLELSEEDPANWITVSSPQDAFEGSGVILLNILENAARTPRNGIVKVYSVADPELYAVLQIDQAGKIYTISVEPSGNIPMTYEADAELELVIGSNDTWRVTVDIADEDEADWVSVVSPTATATGDGSIKLNVTENNGSAVREATVTIVSVAFSDVKQTVTIVQQNQDVAFVIAIPDMTEMLTTGTAIISITDSENITSKISSEIAVDTEGTQIVFH